MSAKFASPESYTGVSTISHHSITNIVYIYNINMWHQWVHSSINKINLGWWCASSMFATNSNFDSIKFAPPTHDQPSNSQSTCCLLGKPNLGQWSCKVTKRWEHQWVTWVAWVSDLPTLQMVHPTRMVVVVVVKLVVVVKTEIEIGHPNQKVCNHKLHPRSSNVHRSLWMWSAGWTKYNNPICSMAYLICFVLI